LQWIISPSPLIIPAVSLQFFLKICEWICGFAIQVVLPVSMTLAAKFTTDVIVTDNKFTTLAFTLFSRFTVQCTWIGVMTSAVNLPLVTTQVVTLPPVSLTLMVNNDGNTRLPPRSIEHLSKKVNLLLLTATQQCTKKY
jgi:hypothetical protein